MRSICSGYIRGVLCAPMLSAILFDALPVRSACAQGGTLEAIAGVPRYNVGPLPSPPFVYVVYVQGVKITATVPTMLAKQANETAAQASQRKATAVVAALNTSIRAAIAAKLLGADTPLATVGTAPATVPNVDKNGALIPGQAATKPNVAAGYGVVTLDGVTEVGGAKAGARDPSGEPGGTAIIRPGAGSTGGAKASLSGPSANSGFATGVDILGARAFVSFGVYELRALSTDCASSFDTIATCTGAYIANVNPAAGQNDAQIFSALTTAFNSLYAFLGLTATYDPLADVLSVDQPLNNYLSFFTQNTDPGLELIEQLSIVPEPATKLLMAALAIFIGIPFAPATRSPAR